MSLPAVSLSNPPKGSTTVAKSAPSAQDVMIFLVFGPEQNPRHHELACGELVESARSESIASALLLSVRTKVLTLEERRSARTPGPSSAACC
jgi:hypothetical protein